MDHKEQHHEHHFKERERKIAQEKEYERKAEKKGIHLGWFVGLGAALIGLIVLGWTFFF